VAWREEPWQQQQQPQQQQQQQQQGMMMWRAATTGRSGRCSGLSSHSQHLRWVTF